MILDMCHNKEEIHQSVEDKVMELGSRGVRSLALARQDNEDGKWKFLGLLPWTFHAPSLSSSIASCHDFLAIPFT